MKWIKELMAGLLLSTGVAASAQVVYLDHQHMDFRIKYDAALEGTNRLGILLRYNATSEVGPDYFVVTNQDVYILGNTNARLTIPSNPNFAFLGTPGAPVWVLPQTQNITLPYVGTSGEEIPDGVFDGPVHFELISAEGPGNFFAWANSGASQPPTIKFICTNGVVSPNHNVMTPLIGSHEHYNWGFSTNGLYRVTFRCSGLITNGPVGQTNDFVVGQEVAWAFQILPLRPWEHWVSTNWLPTTATNIAGKGADPDSDGTVNLLEYAFGSDPNLALRTNLPACVMVRNFGTNYGALNYTWATNATDLILNPVASSVLNDAGSWQTISNVTGVVSNNPATQLITVRDNQPAATSSQRFYQLRVRLSYP